MAILTKKDKWYNPNCYENSLKNHECFEDRYRRFDQEGYDGVNEMYPLEDCYGIHLCYVCDLCEDAKRSKYKPETFTGYGLNNYTEFGEQIEPDEF